MSFLQTINGDIYMYIYILFLTSKVYFYYFKHNEKHELNLKSIKYCMKVKKKLRMNMKESLKKNLFECNTLVTKLVMYFLQIF